MRKLNIFKFKNNIVDIIMVGGIPLFNSGDVRKCLGLPRYLGEKYISSKGVYRLELRARRNKAVNFQLWLVNKVYPLLEKHKITLEKNTYKYIYYLRKKFIFNKIK